MRAVRIGVVLAAVVIVACGCADASDLGGPDPDDSTASTPTQTPQPTKHQPEPTTPVPNVSECRPFTDSAVLSGITDSSPDIVDCGDRHNTQTVYVETATGPLKRLLADRDTTAIFDKMLPVCRARLASWTGSTVPRLSRTLYGVLVGIPSAEDIDRGASWIRCDVWLSGDDDLPTSLPEQTRGTLSDETTDFDVCTVGTFTDGSINTRPCSLSHEYRGISSIRLGDPTESYPGQPAIRKVLARRCPGEALTYLGSSARSGYTFPLRTQWQSSTGFGVCYALTPK